MKTLTDTGTKIRGAYNFAKSISGKLRFIITIELDRKQYRLLVEQVYVSESKELFRVSARNSSIVLESNRPIFINKRLKDRKQTWKIKDGKVYNLICPFLIGQ